MIPPMTAPPPPPSTDDSAWIDPGVGIWHPVAAIDYVIAFGIGYALGAVILYVAELVR